jgi:CheY-like chemotaxis protein
VANLLIIDDDPDLAEALSEVLEAEGHQVRMGFDGAEGMHLVQQQMPDLALLDVEMPLVGGPAMVTRMLLHDMGLETIPVVFISGVPNLREIAQKVGTPYFLGKPYRREQLLRLLSRALAERAAPQPHLGHG